MTIGTATNHNTDFTNILGERSNASHYYTTQQIIDEELTNIQTSDAAIDSEIPNAEAKCLAFSRLCAAVETPIWLDVQRHNQLVDDIIGFHSTRLATAAMLDAYNATIPQGTRDGVKNTNTIPIGFQSLYDPNTSTNGRDYLNTPANGTANILAWPSNIGIGSTSIGVSTSSTKLDNDVNYHEQSRYQYQIKRGCAISLNPDEHWTGTYRPGYPRTENGTLYTDEDGNPVFGDIPDLLCPLVHQLTGSGETDIFKVNIRIQGYDLEGENPIEIVECDLSGETAGVGTISIYQTSKHRFDAGINTTLSGSWTWDGVSYSGDVVPGSANYTNFIQPKLTEIAELKTRIQEALPNLNRIKDARTDTDLYYWSLEHSKVVEGERKSKKEGNIQAIVDSQNIYNESAGVPPPSEPEINPVFNKPFEELTESEKQQLSLTYGLGTPREIISRDEDGDPIKDENGEIVMTTDDGYNIDYIDSKVQEFLELNKNLDVTGDFVVTMPGSIIVVNSVGSATTYTGISTQINNIKTGGINTSNITGGSQPITIFKPDEVGFKTSNILKSPAHVVGSAATFSGSIGVATAQWEEIFVRTIHTQQVVGAAKSIRVSAASTDAALPLVFSSGVTTMTTPADLLIDNPDLTYQEDIGKLTSTGVKANTIYDSGDDTGENQQVPVADGTGGWQWSAPPVIGVSTAGGAIGNVQYHNNAGLIAGSNEFNFIQSTGRVGIGSTQPSQKLDVSGNVSVGGSIMASDTSTITGNLDLTRGTSNSGLTRSIRLCGARNNSTTDDYAAIKFENFDSNSAATEYIGAKIAARLPLGNNVDGGELSFYTTPDTTAPVERLRIDQNGLIGIGTDDPDYELDVIGSIGVGSTLFFVNRPGSGHVAKIDSTANGGTIQLHADVDIAFFESDHDTEMFRFDVNTTNNDSRIILQGDTDTFFNHPAADQLAFTAGDTQRLSISGYGLTVTGSIDVSENVELRLVKFANLEKTDLSVDGDLGFDSSQGLILHRTQQGVSDATVTVLDGANVQAGNGINISNLQGGVEDTGRITFSVDAADNTIDVASNGISVNGSNLTNVAAATVATSAENTSTNSRFITFADDGSGQQALKTDTGLKYVPTSNTLTAGTFSGSLSGTATNATNVRVDHDTGDAWHPICFVNHGSDSQANLRIRTNDDNNTIAANPDNGSIRATTFVGALSGNATSANSAGDSDQLGGVDAGNYLRSNTADSCSGTITFTAPTGIIVSGSAPEIKLNDTSNGADDFWLHANSNNFYVLADRNNNDDHETPHPLQLEADTNIGYVFGERIIHNNETSTFNLDAQLVSERTYTNHTNFNISIRNKHNGGRAVIRFNDSESNSATQFGYLQYTHVNTASNSAGDSFHFDSSEGSTAVIIDKTGSNAGFYVGSTRCCLITESARLTLTRNSSYPLVIDGDNNAKILLAGSSDPYIRFRENNTDRAYIQFRGSKTNSDILFKNQQTGVFTMESGGEKTAVLALVRNDSNVVNGNDTAQLVFGHTDGGSDWPDGQTATLMPCRIVAEAVETQGTGDDGHRLKFYTKDENKNRTQESQEAFRAEDDGDVIFYHSHGQSSSDARIKDNVVEIENCLDKVLQLRGVEYDRNDSPSAVMPHEYGLIAQEVELICPTLVKESYQNDRPDGITDIKVLDYTGLIPVLINAVKDQNQIIQSLQSRIEALENP